MGLRESLMPTLAALDAEDVVGEAAREFRDGRGHGAKVAAKN